jgi:hemerythrin-like domain-containing protein
LTIRQDQKTPKEDFVMRATDILREEHRVIKDVLLCLEKMAERACGPAGLDAKSAHEAVEFLRHFADHCHHAKEEACLFPLMEARGFPRESGPTGVMLAEHDEGRSLLKTVAAHIDAAAAGDAQAARAFASAAEAYCDLLHRHICKENKRLFPMADTVFDDDDQRQLLERFSSIEHCKIGPGVHERYLKIATDLADLFEVTHGCERSSLQ